MIANHPVCFWLPNREEHLKRMNFQPVARAQTLKHVPSHALRPAPLPASDGSPILVQHRRPPQTPLKVAQETGSRNVSFTPNAGDSSDRYDGQDVL